MKRAKKLLTVVVALAMMVSVGSIEGVTAEAATCPPHGDCVNRHVATSYPLSGVHDVYVYNYDTNQNEYVGECSYSYQYVTMALVCTRCNQVVSTYEYTTEIHQHPICPEYGDNKSN